MTVNTTLLVNLKTGVHNTTKNIRTFILVLSCLQYMNIRPPMLCFRCQERRKHFNLGKYQSCFPISKDWKLPGTYCL